jgi:hypothetical protein
MTLDPRLESINRAIQLLPDDVKNKISDGYHTFGELYEHRCLLYILWINCLQNGTPWKSKKHSDGTSFDGWFVSGIELDGNQITYHLPLNLWNYLHAEEIEKAVPFDGHTAQDVILRIRTRLGMKNGN